MRGDRSPWSFRRGDAVAIGAVLALAAVMLALFLFSVGGEQATVARVYQDGALIREIPLSRDTEFSVGGAYTNRIAVRGGRIAIVESDCPGGDCVHSGWIHRPGRSIVCLPNRVEIRLEGALEEDDVDAVVW